TLDSPLSTFRRNSLEVSGYSFRWVLFELVPCLLLTLWGLVEHNCGTVKALSKHYHFLSLGDVSWWDYPLETV
ncbi:7822_t:CDS:2, partial [Funneliformis geosporum]